MKSKFLFLQESHPVFISSSTKHPVYIHQLFIHLFCHSSFMYTDLSIHSCSSANHRALSLYRAYNVKGDRQLIQLCIPDKYNKLRLQKSILIRKLIGIDSKNFKKKTTNKSFGMVWEDRLGEKK